jgi:hypothetical protein
VHSTYTLIWVVYTDTPNIRILRYDDDEARVDILQKPNFMEFIMFPGKYIVTRIDGSELILTWKIPFVIPSGQLQERSYTEGETKKNESMVLERNVHTKQFREIN